MKQIKTILWMGTRTEALASALVKLEQPPKLVPANGAPARPPPPQEPWVSRRHWRRALAISIEGGLTAAERRKLLARLARTRTGDGRPKASPRLRLVRGGERAPPARPPLPGAGPGSKEAA